MTTYIDNLCKSLRYSLSEEEQCYIFRLEREIMLRVLSAIDTRNFTPIIIFLKTALSKPAIRLFELRGYSHRMEPERSTKDGIAFEIYKMAICLD